MANTLKEERRLWGGADYSLPPGQQEELMALEAYKTATAMSKTVAANEGERLCAEVERLRAALSKATGALSAIAYLVGHPNEKELSFYDVFPDEERLVKAVQNRLAERGSGK